MVQVLVVMLVVTLVMKIMVMGLDRKIRHMVQIGEERFKVSEINGQCKFCSEFFFFFSKKFIILFLMTPSIFPNDV